MKKTLLSIILLLAVVQPAQAILMTNDGIDSGRGFLRWDDLISLPKRVNARMDTFEAKINRLQNLCIIGMVGVAAALIYMKWVNKPQQQADDESDLVIVNNI